MVGSAARREAPWTDDPREVVAVDEAREAFIRYFHGSMKARNWLPWDDLPRAEIRAQGPAISEDTVAILHGLIGVEDAANDIVADALAIIHRRHALRNFYLAWGIEELKHPEAWVLALVEAGRGDEADLHAYRDVVTAERWWTRDDNPALATPLGIVCLGLVQEQTYYALYEALATHLRHELGLSPEAAGDGERGPGLVGVAQLIARDELGHRDAFLDLFQIFQRQMPDEARATLAEALRDFRLPALTRLPDHAELVAALARTGIATPQRWETEVRDVLLALAGE